MTALKIRTQLTVLNHSSTSPCDSKLVMNNRFLISSNFAGGSALVKISANWSADLHTSNLISSPATSSRIKWCFISMCFVLPCITGFFVNATADTLSQKTWVAWTCGCFKSLSSLRSHTAWQAAAVAATYSASVDDKATVACFFELHAITPEPKRKQFPFVLFLSSWDPAQTLSVYPVRKKHSFFLYQTPKFLVPVRIEVPFFLPPCVALMDSA